MTDTFGQALWLADSKQSTSMKYRITCTIHAPYTAILYGAALNISRMYLHQGATLVFQSGNQANSYVSLVLYIAISLMHLCLNSSPGFSWVRFLSFESWYNSDQSNHPISASMTSGIPSPLIVMALRGHLHPSLLTFS